MSDAAGGEAHAAECLLVRGDGSRWAVEALELTHECFRVTARLRDGEGEPERLVSEPLTPDDQLLWLDGDGEEMARVRGAEA